MLPLFDDLVGHEQIRDVLSRVIARPGQAYLFHGPRGVGKRMLAERFAAALLFSVEEQSKLDRTHLADRLQSHPDFLLFKREDGAKEFTVRQARELLQRVSLSSARGGKIVVLIEAADTLNEEAANALLKTVEEPSPALVFLFLAERPDRLPATLRSRLAPLAFLRVPRTQIADWLKTTHGVADPEPLAEAARGCPGKALEYLNDLSGWRTFKERTNALTEPLIHGDQGARLATIERFVNEAERSENTTEAWYELLEHSGRAIQKEWLSHPLETVRMARGLIHASKLVGGSLSPRFALEWNGTLPLVPKHFIPRSLDPSSLFSL
jgi:replication-associated recombination protein RarA